MMKNIFAVLALVFAGNVCAEPVCAVYSDQDLQARTSPELASLQGTFVGLEHQTSSIGGRPNKAEHDNCSAQFERIQKIMLAREAAARQQRNIR